MLALGAERSGATGFGWLVVKPCGLLIQVSASLSAQGCRVCGGGASSSSFSSWDGSCQVSCWFLKPSRYSEKTSFSVFPGGRLQLHSDWAALSCLTGPAEGCPLSPSPRGFGCLSVIPSALSFLEALGTLGDGYHLLMKTFPDHSQTASALTQLPGTPDSCIRVSEFKSQLQWDLGEGSNTWAPGTHRGGPAFLVSGFGLAYLWLLWAFWD